MKRKYNEILLVFSFVLLLIFGISVANSNKEQKIIETSSNSSLSNKKIEWGIKREENHKQPDVGTLNKQIIDKYDGYCLGNPESKNVYLTFDNGYEAGYTEKILNVLKENKVPAVFFVTGHYVNTQPDLIKRMIDEGHIVRKSYC